MKYKEQDERELAPDPRGAFLDAQRRSELNRGNFTDALKRTAQQLYSLAVDAYPRSRVYLNYRQKFIAVKVEGAHRPDHTELTKLNEFCDANKVYGVRLGTNLVHRLYK